MTEIYTFPLDLWRVTEMEFSLEAISSMSPASAWNPFVFSDGPTTEYWHVIATLAPARADGWRPIAALFRKLRGRRNLVRLFDSHRCLRGAGAVSPTINIEAAAAAGETTITVYGLKPGESVALAADDMIGIAENLYAISDDTPSDAEGKATISILPPLRLGVAMGDTVNLQRPTGLFQLVSPPGQLLIAGRRQPLTVEFVENPNRD